MILSIAESIRFAAQTLREHGVPEARREATSLLAHALKADLTFLLLHPQQELTQQELERFQASVTRRAQGEPLQYITRRQEFYGLEFEVTPDVLIPRPDTELLVEAALKVSGDRKAPYICDVGTGSGCIAIALLHELPHARAVGIDISMPAIRVAHRNATRHSVAKRFAFLVSESLTAVKNKPVFDLIVSNPPYVSAAALEGLQREVRDFEPRAALSPGPDGLLLIRHLLRQSEDCVRPEGHLLFEIGFDQGAAVEGMIDSKQWKLLDIHQDLQGIPRTVALQKRDWT